MRLLVVEDEDRIASFLDEGLTAHGYAVEWARTGDISLDVLTREVTMVGRTVSLSEREFSLLRAFVGYPARYCPAASCSPWPGG